MNDILLTRLEETIVALQDRSVRCASFDESTMSPHPLNCGACGKRVEIITLLRDLKKGLIECSPYCEKHQIPKTCEACDPQENALCSFCGRTAECPECGPCRVVGRW